MLTSCHVINPIPSTVLGGQISYTVLFLMHLCFICLQKSLVVCYVHVLGSESDKLDPRSIKCVLLRYSLT